MQGRGYFVHMAAAVQGMVVVQEIAVVQGMVVVRGMAAVQGIAVVRGILVEELAVDLDRES